MLKQRLITAAILIPLFVSGVMLLPTMALAVALGAVLALGFPEWCRLFSLSGGWAAGCIAVLLVGCGLAVVAAYHQKALWGLLAVAVVGWLAAALRMVMVASGRPVVGIRRVGPDGRRWVLAVLLAGVVLLPPLAALVYLHGSGELGARYVLFLVTLIWVADSAAYFGGRRWGRHRLAPRLSPGKTWEGVVCALVGALLWTVLWYDVLGVQHRFVFLLWVGGTVAASIVGDLFESALKREAGIKDSGSLLPGHGGVLDRIDSLLAAAPVFALGLAVTG